MPSARTLAVFPSDRICATRRAALNFSARTSRRTRGPFVNVVLNNIDVTPRLFVHPMDGGFFARIFPLHRSARCRDGSCDLGESKWCATIRVETLRSCAGGPARDG